MLFRGAFFGQPALEENGVIFEPHGRFVGDSNLHGLAHQLRKAFTGPEDLPRKRIQGLSVAMQNVGIALEIDE
ncbi:hypothetical protein Ocepr_2307 (plasmid) [Oceanithermus profundus DSM 14977]|uniref:Uncharacterized protein n=1 Tax=Oceanithermus profundus (strain DSM 14977 / NBRC 100410 / VKM B-2274 / 506) TaxID=670487 RepID=E4UAX0_OCEP5|nr:hypothetical protein Ocepr_2307 [Oceanithermus profundus DSM 14977]